MATVTLELPDSLAQRVKPISRWLPTILEINLLPLQTSASQTAKEIIDFLASNPSAKAVHQYYVSERAQERMSKLLDLNREGSMSQGDSTELDELLALASLMTTLKTSLTNTEIA
jgi:hypothetical protein